MHKFLVVLVLGITLLMAFYTVNNLALDSSPQAFLDQSAPSISNLISVSDEFGDTSTLLVILKFDSFPDSNALTGLHKILEGLKSLGAFSSLESIFDAFKTDSFTLLPPSLKIRNYVSRIDESYTLDPQILDDELYAGSLISEDGKNLAVIARLNSGPDNGTDLIASVKRTIEENTRADYFLSGEVLVNQEFFRSIRHLAFLYPPLILLSIMAVYYAKFGSLVLAGISLIPSIMASIWTYFFMLLYVKSLNTLTVLVPSFIIIVGTAYSMHYLSRYIENSTGTTDRSGIAKATRKEESAPVYFSALTTAAGFLSYGFLTMEAFREMGIFVSVGVFITAVFTVHILPGFLFDIKGKKRKKIVVLPFFERIRKPVILSLGILMFCSPYFVSHISLKVDQYSFFRKTSEVIRSASFTLENFHWITPYYLMVKSKDGVFRLDGETTPEMLALVEDLKKIPELSAVRSVLDISDTLGLPPSLTIPLLQSAYGRTSSTSTFLSNQAIRIMLMSPLSDSDSASLIESSVSELLISHPKLLEKFDFTLSGLSLVWRDVNTSIIRNQIQSLIISFLSILLLLLIIFRELKTALVATLPVLTTVLLNFLFMGSFGIPLQISTAIVSGMLMGLVIDYSIHFIIWYRRNGTIEVAFRSTSASIIANGSSLMAGFGVLLTAPLLMYVQVSVLMLWGIFIGVISTLTLLPSILKPSSRTPPSKPIKR